MCLLCGNVKLVYLKIEMQVSKLIIDKPKSMIEVQRSSKSKFLGLSLSTESLVYQINPDKSEEPNFLSSIGLILYKREKGISFVFLFDLCPGRMFREQVSP